MSISRRKAAAQILGAGAAALLAAKNAEATSTTTYNYDAFGRLTDVTYPNGTSITYSYDEAGNRKQIALSPPTLVSAGAGANVQFGSSLNVAYPSGLQSGDAIFLHVIAEHLDDDSISTPSGFTLVQAATANTIFWIDLGIYGGTFQIETALRMAVFKRVATGSESGTVSVSFESNSDAAARMYRCRGGTTTEAATSAANSGENSGGSSISLPNVTTAGANRLVLQFVATATNDSFTQPSPYAQPLDAYSTNNGSIGLCTATETLSGTITGGACSLTAFSDLLGSIAFAVHA